MITGLHGVIGFGLLIVLMASGLHVATAMFLLSIAATLIYMGPALLSTFGSQLWSTMNNYLLTAIPLFILMGELLLRAGVTTRMYESLSDWLKPLPGRLLHTNIGACALFSAISGSSVATAATIGSVAMPELEKRAYSEKWVLGTIAAGGTLGILIPPSVNLIVYGAMTDTSIGALFLGGLIPGLALTGIFMVIVIVAAMFQPKIAGEREATDPLGVRLVRLKGLLPPLGIFLIVVGSIYGGFATPTEAAAVGVVLAFLLAAANGVLNIRMLHDAFISSVKTSSLILLIMVAAFYLNFISSMIGVPQAMSQLITMWGADPLTIVWVLVVFYLILGCFLETMSMMIATIPIVFPIIQHIGLDPVWFGIFLVMMMELALITPPVGMNLYVVQGIRSRGGKMSDIFLGVLPFIGGLLLLVAIIIYVPQLATWLPSVM
jgi:tripartite ATP-independent transporter DctM subunit